MNKTELGIYLQKASLAYLEKLNCKFDKKNLNFYYYSSADVFFKVVFHPIKALVSNGTLGYKVQTFIAVYNLRIDEVFKKVSKKHQLQNAEYYPLLSAGVAELMVNEGLEAKIVNGTFYIEVADEIDFERNEDKFRLVFQNYILPFIEKYSNLEEQYYALQFDPLKPHVLSMWRAERIMKSIILAKIIGKTDWPLLFAKYEPLFKDFFNKDSQEEFYNLRQLMLGH